MIFSHFTEPNVEDLLQQVGPPEQQVERLTVDYKETSGV